MRQAENTTYSIMFRKIRIAGSASGQKTQELFAKNKFPEERKHFSKPTNLDTKLPQITVAISGSDCVSKPFFVCFHGSTTVWSASSDLTRITRAPASLWQAQADRQDADISDRPQAITGKLSTCRFSAPVGHSRRCGATRNVMHEPSTTVQAGYANSSRPSSVSSLSTDGSRKMEEDGDNGIHTPMRLSSDPACSPPVNRWHSPNVNAACSLSWIRGQHSGRKRKM